MKTLTRQTGRRGLAGFLIALAAIATPGGLVHAQSPSSAVVDACSLLTDEEVLAATGAVAVTSVEPTSSLSAAGYSSGCTRRLEPAAGLSSGAILELDYGFQEPGGRSLYEGQLAVSPAVTHIAGLGDDAFQGISSDWYAVKGDATLALQYLGVGVFDTSLRRGELAARALTWRAMSRLPGSAASADATGPVCVIGAQALSALVGITFTSLSPGELNCLYQGGPASGPYAMDVRLEDPPVGSTDATLGLVRLGPGEEVTVAGRPAWTSDEALWVDLGARLLVVQPIFEFSRATPPPQDITRPVAELVVERIAPELADPTPERTPASDVDLAALFPTQLRGAPVAVQTITGRDIAAQMGDAAADAMSAIVAEQGLTLDDLSIGVADLFNAADRDGSIIAIRLRGADAGTFGIPLLLATQGAADLPVGRTQDTVAGKEVLVLDIPGVDTAQAIHAYTRDDIAWFVRATTCVSYTPERGCEMEEIDQPLLEEILGALP
jgi:hypothetical protein